MKIGGPGNLYYQGLAGIWKYYAYFFDSLIPPAANSCYVRQDSGRTRSTGV